MERYNNDSLSLQGSRTPFCDWGPGPLELGKIAVFSLKLGKNQCIFCYPYTIVLVSLIVHHVICILHGTFADFDITYYYSQVYPFFLHFSIFFSRSQIGKTLGLNWEKKILFCIGNGAEYRPQIRQIESPALRFGVISAFWSHCWRVLIQLFIDIILALYM